MNDNGSRQSRRPGQAFADHIRNEENATRETILQMLPDVERNIKNGIFKRAAEELDKISSDAKIAGSALWKHSPKRYWCALMIKEETKDKEALLAKAREIIKQASENPESEEEYLTAMDLSGEYESELDNGQYLPYLEIYRAFFDYSSNGKRSDELSDLIDKAESISALNSIMDELSVLQSSYPDAKGVSDKGRKRIAELEEEARRQAAYSDARKKRDEADRSTVASDFPKTAELYALAASLFDKAENYKDAAKLSAYCLKRKAEFDAKEKDRIKSEAEAAEKEANYAKLVASFSAAKTKNEFSRLKSEFTKMNGYREADKYISACDSEIKKITDSEKTAQDNKKNYNLAKSYFDKGHYGEALQIFEALGDYLDSPVLLEDARSKLHEIEARYLKLSSDMKRNENNQSDYRALKAAFAELGSYKDSSALAEECERRIKQLDESDKALEKTEKAYQSAKALFAARDFRKAMDSFAKISDYKDSKELYDKCASEIEAHELRKKARYEALVNDFKDNSKPKDISAYESLKAEFIALGDYKEAIRYVGQCDLKINELKNEAAKNSKLELDYQKASNFFAKNNFEKALEIFTSIKGFKDSSSMCDKCNTEIARIKEEEKRAVKREEQQKSDKYDSLVKDMEKQGNTIEDFERIRTGFISLGDYKQSKFLLSECDSRIKKLEENKSRQRELDIKYQEAKRTFDSAKTSEDFTKTEALFFKLLGHRDSSEMCDKSRAKAKEKSKEADSAFARLLSKLNARNEAELIEQGKDFASDPDYKLACTLGFSSQCEKYKAIYPVWQDRQEQKRDPVGYNNRKEAEALWLALIQAYGDGKTEESLIKSEHNFMADERYKKAMSLADSAQKTRFSKVIVGWQMEEKKRESLLKYNEEQKKKAAERERIKRRKQIIPNIISGILVPFCNYPAAIIFCIIGIAFPAFGMFFSGVPVLNFFRIASTQLFFGANDMGYTFFAILIIIVSIINLVSAIGLRDEKSKSHSFYPPTHVIQLILTLVIVIFGAIGLSGKANVVYDDGVIITYRSNDEGYEVKTIQASYFGSHELTIPDTYLGKPVNKISDDAMATDVNSGLKKINIGKNIKYIGNEAFSTYYSSEKPNDCANINYLGTFHDWIKIEFGEVTSDTYIFMQPYSLTMNDTPLLNVTLDSYSPWLIRCRSIQSLTISNMPDIIPQKAFYDCRNLGSIVLKGNYTAISSYAFENCILLKEINIPASVETIGRSAFSSCPAELIWADGINLKSDLKDVYKGYTGRHVTFPSSTVEIPEDTFNNNDLITSVTIPQSVKQIGKQAFAKCDALVSVEIYGEEVIIGEEAFTKCKWLTDINIHGSVESIGANAFTNCDSLKSVTLPDGLKSLGMGAFSECDNLRSIYIPSGIRMIPMSLFQNSKSLKEVNYGGTKAEWEALRKEWYWDNGTLVLTIICTDGNIEE